MDFYISHRGCPWYWKPSFGSCSVRQIVMNRPVPMILHDLIPWVPTNRVISVGANGNVGHEKG